MEQTEKMLEEMLENLLDSEENNDSCDNESSTPHESNTDNESDTEECNNNTENSNKESSSESDNEKQITAKSSKTTIAEELEKLRNEFPIETDVNNAIYTNTDTKLISSKDSDNDGNNSIPSYFDEATIAFRKEVARVFADKSEFCPQNNTQAYFNAAQEYAIYGEHFMDFLPDFDKLYAKVNIEHKIKTSTLTSMESMNTEESHDNQVHTDGVSPTLKIGEQATFNGNNAAVFRELRLTPTAQAAIQNKPLRAVATAGAATAATYYQLCSSLQPALRPGSTVNSAVHASNATTTVNANMLLNNNLSSACTNNATNPYVNTPYQATSNITANIRFTPNSPLTPTIPTQQNSNNISNITVNGTTGDAKVFEHIVYAQLLQQQLSQTQQLQLQQQQRQQAIAATTIFQQQLLLQQQNKMAQMAVLQRQVARVAEGNNNATSIGMNVVAANRCLQRFAAPSPLVFNQQTVNLSTLAATSQPTIRTPNTNSFNPATNINDNNINNFCAGGNNGSN